MQVLEAAVRQSGNRVDLDVRGAESVFYEVDGIDLPPLADHSFALWHLAAYGMATGKDIHLHGVVDPVVLENVRRNCRTWAMWQPGTLHRVNITVDDIAEPAPPASSDLVTFFSGGVDSTHMMLERGVLDRAGFAVTVHGMDYDLYNPSQFEELRNATAPLLQHLNYRPLTLRSDAKKIVKGYHAYAMAIAGHAWLFSSAFGGAEMAADFTQEQDLLTFPWTSNAITNGYFKGSYFQVHPRSESVGRTQKVRTIATNAIALDGITFCNVRGLRPRNCGRCKKCLRTKAMFMVAIGAIPQQIFVDPGFDERSWSTIDLNNKNELVFFLDMFETARDSGRLPPGLQAAYDARFSKPLRLDGAKFRDFMRKITGRRPKRLGSVRAVDPHRPLR